VDSFLVLRGMGGSCGPGSLLLFGLNYLKLAIQWPRPLNLSKNENFFQEVERCRLLLVVNVEKKNNQCNMRHCTVMLGNGRSSK
jgi:hypothetical protein